MQTLKQVRSYSWILFLAIAGISLLTSAIPGGIDRYTITMNKKVLVSRTVDEPLTLNALDLSKAANEEKLVVFYTHCHKVANDRKLVLKDNAGNIIKEWRFRDDNGTTTPMVILVKEIRELEKKNRSLSLVYISKQKPEGQLLVGLS